MVLRREVSVRRLASEFPNDNEALHGGVTWAVLTLGAPATPVLRRDRDSGIVVRGAELDRGEAGPPEGLALAELVAAFDAPCDAAELLEEIDAFGGDGPVIVDELESLDAAAADAMVEEAMAADASACVSEDDSSAESEDAYLVLVDRLVELASFEKASAGRIVEHLLLATSAVPELDDAVRASLREGGIVDAADVPSPTFVTTVAAWRGILRGTDEDLLGACGGRMLDEWAADVVARALGAPTRADVLRKELRARGVAAFGLAWAA